MSLDIDIGEIAQLFIEESHEGLDIMESGLLELNAGAADPETINAIFRAAHSIKGGGGTFGFIEVSDFAHHVETLLDEMRHGSQPVTTATIDLLLESVDCLREMIAGLGSGEVDTTRAKQLEVALGNVLGSVAAAVSDVGSADEGVLEGYRIRFQPHAGMLKSCNDPLRILGELEVLGERQLEVVGAEALNLDELDPEICSLGWKLELRGDFTREQIMECFAWVEDECDLELEPIVAEVAAAPVTDNSIEKTTPAPASSSTTGGRSGSTDSNSIRVNIDKIDELINLVGELVITQSMLSRYNGDFDFSHLQNLREGLSQLSRNTRELQESVMAIRMLPISFAFSRFPRLVRDVSNSLSKEVELVVSGEGTELDKTVLEKIGDPLVHLVRNSLDHGIETPEQRLAAGKPEHGTLQLNAYHEGGSIVIEVIDDGAGINQDKVLEKARKQGLVGADENLSADRINNLIFLPGFSTAESVSDLSGRGVGMDVVRRNIADLGGDVSVKSTMGEGSTFTIRLPLTLAILDGQLVRVGQESYIISLVSIVETIQCPASKVHRVAGEAEMFQLRDEYLPVLRLHELFGTRPDNQEIDRGLLVVAEANGERVGIFVDDLLEQQQVVIKSLEANYQQVKGLSGATILGDGRVALIVDVPGLISLFHERGPELAMPLAS